jgi:hypothetical protein
VVLPGALIVLMVAPRYAQAQGKTISFDASISQPPGSTAPIGDGGLVTSYNTAPLAAGSQTFFTQGFALGGTTSGPILPGGGQLPNGQPQLVVMNNASLCPLFLGLTCLSNGTQALLAADPFSLSKQGGGFIGVHSFEAWGVFPPGGCGNPCTGNGTTIMNATSLQVVGFRSGVQVVQQTFPISMTIQTFVLTDPLWFNVGRVVFIPLDAGGNPSTSIVAMDNIQVQYAENSVASDFDGDGVSDPAIFRPSGGGWYILNSSTNFSTFNSYSWGLSGDVPMSGDFDGDAKTDPAVYRPSNGTWYILKSSSGYTSSVQYQWGTAGDVPVAGDFDGDGKTDITVFRPSTGVWYILTSTSGFTSYSTFTWGVSTDVPMMGDFDGDGKTDIAVFRPSEGGWYILKSSTNFSTFSYLNWGVSTDTPLVGDFDGDGKSDVAVYRPSTGTWYVLRSSSNYTTYNAIVWGTPTDIPIVADFDDDGASDVVMYRPSTGAWYILESSTGFTTPNQYNWGIGTDIPLPKRQ